VDGLFCRRTSFPNSALPTPNSLHCTSALQKIPTARVWTADNLHQQRRRQQRGSDGIVLGQRLIPAPAEQVRANLQERARAIIEARPDLEHTLGD
jgi:hypothetical protein